MTSVLGRLLAHAPEQRQPVDSGSRMSHSIDVEDVGRDQRQPFRAVGGQRHPVPGVAKRVAHERAEVGLVVNQEDVEHGGLRLPVTCGDNLRIRKSDLHPKYVFSSPWRLADGPEQAQVQRRERRLVLLVDDCQDTRELYAEYLELSGFDVKEAGDGIVAIERGGTGPPGHHRDGYELAAPGWTRSGAPAARRRAHARASRSCHDFWLRRGQPPSQRRPVGPLPRQAVPARGRWSAS